MVCLARKCYKMKKILVILFVSMFAVGAKAQMIAVETDLMWDALQTPNIGFELVTGERTTAGIHVYGNKNPWGKEMKVIGVQPEFRYFFSGRPMHREFVGIGAIGSVYDITWGGKVYDGIALGGGITFGYVFNLSSRLNLDCHAGFGLIAYKRKEYFEGDSFDQDYSINGVQRTNASGYYLLPTRIGVSLTYIFK